MTRRAPRLRRVAWTAVAAIGASETPADSTPGKTEDKAKDKENRTRQFTGLVATMKAAAEAK